jgi:hypothetical protein
VVQVRAFSLSPWARVIAENRALAAPSRRPRALARPRPSSRSRARPRFSRPTPSAAQARPLRHRSRAESLGAAALAAAHTLARQRRLIIRPDPAALTRMRRVGCAAAGRTPLPLPAGEGWGEGALDSLAASAQSAGPLWLHHRPRRRPPRLIRNRPRPRLRCPFILQHIGRPAISLTPSPRGCACACGGRPSVCVSVCVPSASPCACDYARSCEIERIDPGHHAAPI